MKLSIVNEIAAKPHPWLKLLALKLRNWLDDFLAEDGATVEGPHSDQGEPMFRDAAPSGPEDGGPPDHWLALIREHAPELVISRDEPDRSPVGTPASPDLSDGNFEGASFTPAEPEIKVEHSEQMNSQIPMRNSYSSPILCSNTPSETAASSKLWEPISRAAPVQGPRSSEPYLREMLNVPVASNPINRSDATSKTPMAAEGRGKNSPPSDKAFLRFPARDFNCGTGSLSNTVRPRKTTTSVQPRPHVQQVSSSGGKSPAEVEHSQDEREQRTPPTRTDLPPNWTLDFRDARPLEPNWIVWKAFPHHSEPPAHRRPQQRHEDYSAFHDEFRHHMPPIEPQPAVAERTWLEHDLWPELPVEPPAVTNWTKSVTASEHIALLEREQRGGH
jgi:hypothetical protein